MCTTPVSQFICDVSVRKRWTTLPVVQMTVFCPVSGAVPECSTGGREQRLVSAFAQDQKDLGHMFS